MGIFHVNFITSIEICAIFSFFTRNLLVKLIIKKKCWNVYLKRALNLLSHKSGLCVCVFNLKRLMTGDWKNEQKMFIVPENAFPSEL